MKILVSTEKLAADDDRNYNERKITREKCVK